MSAIEVVGLTKHYRQGDAVVRALDGVTLDVDSGEFLSVVGRSGSGKTTFLDLIGLLLRPTAGSVHIDGVDTGGLSDSRRADLRAKKVGFIFQEYNLLPTLSALENVMLPLRYNGTKRRARNKGDTAEKRWVEANGAPSVTNRTGWGGDRDGCRRDAGVFLAEAHTRSYGLQLHSAHA